ncbi:DUF805 domain-containing protein [Methylobacterium sp. NEAU 140]|uniref:DUF805 domain-containing protein n=1 Tax=Methylobacterium sp. NEAU 140 TaxID=3064945 RepID=UPI00273646F5|nr:DUF805 domain-containing protein [Methylobacterium sp. NEAU 140]MDP4021275.1 DUF805 domain-containing protein [Methylobacterium sp. NEAU 140]
MISDTAAWLRDGYIRTMRRYAVFGGRSPREQLSAFFYACLLLYLIALGADRLGGLVWPGFRGVRLTVGLVHVLPFLALVVRRLHDLDRSGWTILWPPNWGLVFRVRGGTEPNRFGPAAPGSAGLGALSAEVDAGSAKESASKQGLRAVHDCNAIGNGSSQGATAPSSGGAGSPRSADGESRERTVDKVQVWIEALRTPTWFLLFWFGLVLSGFGLLLLGVFVMTLSSYGSGVVDRTWSIAVAGGILSLAVGAFLLRCARAAYRRRRAVTAR